MKIAPMLAAGLLLAACQTLPTRGYTTPRSEEASLPQPREVAPAPPMVKESTIIEEDLVTTRACPVGVRGITVHVEETAEGAALVFTSLADSDQLRTQLYALAETHNELHARKGELPGVRTISANPERDERVLAGGGAQVKIRSEGDLAPNDEDQLVLTHSRAGVEPIDNGARLSFTSAPEDLPALRNELAQHADHLEKACAWGPESAVPEPDPVTPVIE